MNARHGAGGGLVYSTDHGKMCPNCAKAVAACVCGRAAPPASGDGFVRVGRETKGRKGKGVTLITGILLPAPGLTDLCKTLKTRCGSGGTVKDGVIEIQGDHREVIAGELTKAGWRVKLTGV